MAQYFDHREQCNDLRMWMGKLLNNESVEIAMREINKIIDRLEEEISELETERDLLEGEIRELEDSQEEL